jgi:hypothetical protein
VFVVRRLGNQRNRPQRIGYSTVPARYFTASITRATLPKISAMSFSLAISGGDSAMVSPVTRITMPSSWNAFSIAL